MRLRARPLALALGAALGALLGLGLFLWIRPGTPPDPPEASLDGQALYRAHCAVCHGPTGKGDGPGGRVIRQAMRDFSSAAAMQSVDDRTLAAIIAKGSSQFGRSNAMPAWGMKLSGAQIQALVAHIRSLSSARRGGGGKEAP
jgi:mono/diheme cytochrome c family protein